MKGLNCYAVFWAEPGIEKFPNFNQAKANFLKPVTPRLPQQGPTLRSAVDGFEPGRSVQDGTVLPSTVFLSSTPKDDGGLQSFQLPSHAFVVLAARRLLQGLVYFTERSAPGFPGACRFLGKHGDI
ncbi:hypothetical protein ES703_56868 [subsurface metagenome]|jgi:hypothetical protein